MVADPFFIPCYPAATLLLDFGLQLGCAHPFPDLPPVDASHHPLRGTGLFYYWTSKVANRNDAISLTQTM